MTHDDGTTSMALATEATARHSRSSRVHSVERVFVLLETISDNGGAIGLSQLANKAGLPLPTTHRLTSTLVKLGYVRQGHSRQYVLGPRLIRLGESSAKILAVWARPYLQELVDEFGESANLAMLDGDQIVYSAQVPSRHSMRMFTEVGRRVLPHCTAVGKALLADRPAQQVRQLLHRTGMPRHTENTITNPKAFNEELRLTHERGYALDEGEQELGVRCVAMAVPDSPVRLAISISGPATRMTDSLVIEAVPMLAQACEGLSTDLR